MKTDTQTDDTCPKCGSSICTHAWEIDAPETRTTTASGTVKQGRRPMYKSFATQRDEIKAQADKLAEALRDVETRSAYALIRPDKTNNDIQMDYIKQTASKALAEYEAAQ